MPACKVIEAGELTILFVIVSASATEVNSIATINARDKAFANFSFIVLFLFELKNEMQR